MSKATLAVVLSKLSHFIKPKTKLEQYPTPSEAAATILWDAHMKNLLFDKHVIDLGAGTGILGIGALLLDAKKVDFVDVDKDLVEQIKNNITIAEELTGQTLMPRANILIKDAITLTDKADLVIMNPPFGTKEAYIDTEFLKKASKLANDIYTFHKATTDKHIQSTAKTEGFLPVENFKFTFNLLPTMVQHQKKKHPVAITCWHFKNHSAK